MLGSRVMPSFANSIAAFSEEWVANLFHGVLLLYLVVSSALEHSLLIGSCMSEKTIESCKALLLQPLIWTFGIDRF